MCLHNPNGLLVFRKFKNTASAVCLCSLVTTLGGACQKISEKLFQIDSSRGGFLCHFDSFFNLPIVFVRRFLTLTLDYQPFWMGFVVQINWKNLNWLIYKIRTTLLWKSCLCLYFASYFYFLLETRLLLLRVVGRQRSQQQLILRENKSTQPFFFVGSLPWHSRNLS